MKKKGIEVDLKTFIFSARQHHQKVTPRYISVIKSRVLRWKNLSNKKRFSLSIFLLVLRFPSKLSFALVSCCVVFYVMIHRKAIIHLKNEFCLLFPSWNIWFFFWNECVHFDKISSSSREKKFSLKNRLALKKKININRAKEVAWWWFRIQIKERERDTKLKSWWEFSIECFETVKSTIYNTHSGQSIFFCRKYIQSQNI